MSAKVSDKGESTNVDAKANGKGPKRPEVRESVPDAGPAPKKIRKVAPPVEKASTV